MSMPKKPIHAAGTPRSYLSLLFHAVFPSAEVVLGTFKAMRVLAGRDQKAMRVLAGPDKPAAAESGERHTAPRPGVPS